VTQPKNRPQTFLIAKAHATLQLLLNGWAVQDVLFEGGPDLVAMRGREMVRVKTRYATKSDTGYVFSSGGRHKKTFFELSDSSDFLILVCINANQPAGFYVFPHDRAPKAKAFLHSENGPFPKYKEFFGNWKPLQWKR
ncbi:MAG: hypothetical protein HYS53_01460, partial [Candidatus Aenigmarchaeota archaeon]|nr:hypothetical protein [Candidatus Aenigmarchaeota archaeon]